MPPHGPGARLEVSAEHCRGRCPLWCRSV